MIEFYSDEHYKRYWAVRKKLGVSDRDPYRNAVAYLVALDRVLFEHIGEVLDFEERYIKRECLNRGWQTGTSKKTTRLALNLFNGCTTDGETYTRADGYEDDLPSSYYAPDEIFNNSDYAPFYWQAIKLRFGYDGVLPFDLDD